MNESIDEIVKHLNYMPFSHLFEVTPYQIDIETQYCKGWLLQVL
jgi:hypothetical protein